MPAGSRLLVKMLPARMGLDCGECLPPRRLLIEDEERNLLAALAPTRFARERLAAATNR